MFTGLIEETATVESNQKGTLVLTKPGIFTDIKVGSSICVSGVCLSVTSFDDQLMTFEVMEETLSRSTLGDLKPGDGVNLERALLASGRFEGHIVQGHVDGVGEVKSFNQNILTMQYPQSLHGLIVEKGSITIDGVSLTVTAFDQKTFSVALIPLTLKETTLGNLQKGNRVNLEADVIGKYVRATVSTS